MNEDKFDSIVGGFYRAATGDLAWSDALNPVQAVFGARGAMLQTLHTGTGRLLAHHGGGPDVREPSLVYVRDWCHIDPRRQHLLSQGAAAMDRWGHCHETFDDAFAARDRFYQHFLAAFDTRYISYIPITVGEAVATLFALELPAGRGPLNVEEREWARRLGVHAREALRAYERVRLLTEQALAGHGLLKAFPYPMWLLDTDRRVHYSNPATQSLRGATHELSQRGAYLTLNSDRADSTFLDRLRDLSTKPHGTTGVLKLPGSAFDAPVWLHLSLLVPAASMGAFGHQPLVLATVFDASQVSAFDTYALSNMLGLTPAQARVAAGLGAGKTAQQIASSIGTSVPTVRTHTRQVLIRIGAQRVSHLVSILGSGGPMWAASNDDINPVTLNGALRLRT